MNLTRQDLLTRAVFTRDEDVGIRRCHLLDHELQILHGSRGTPEHRTLLLVVALVV